jgi:hypothetical protein
VFITCLLLLPAAATVLLCTGQQAGALLLGVVNVVGVVTLSTMLADHMSKLAFICLLLPAAATVVLCAGQQAGALLLGVVNVVGVVTLSTMLADPISKLALYRQGLGFVLGLLPYLQTYAAAFFALPLLRLFVDGRRNAAIDDRNDNRLEVSGGLLVARYEGMLLIV